LFIQNVIRALKDSIVTTHIGAETLAFLKFWGVMPASFLIIAIYVKVVNKFSAATIFYSAVSFFLLFFASFAFIFYPYCVYFHVSESTVLQLVTQMPYLKWFIMLLSNWSFSLFYIIAEMWPNTILSLLAWQFINSITSVEQSKRFYILFGLISQTGLIFTGYLLIHGKVLAEFLHNALADLSPGNQVMYVQILLSVVILLGVLAMLMFWYLDNKIEGNADPKFFANKVHNKTSLVENIKFIWHSKYIRLITLLLICYGATINLVEAPWKRQTSSVYTTVSDFTAFSGEYLKYTGICTIILALVGSNIVRKIGWATTAIITPFIMATTGILVFINSGFYGYLEAIMIGFNPVTFAIFAGAIQNVLSKSSKYALFDATKEMVYVPLDDETKTKGKAAADVLGVKLGKSFSAGIQVALLTLLPNLPYDIITRYLFVIFLIVSAVWFYTIYELNKEYLARLKQHKVA
jgi:AAA family ATP:ADP antiporter